MPSRTARNCLVVADYGCRRRHRLCGPVKVWTALGAKVGYIVPNRFEYGYPACRRKSPGWRRNTSPTC